ncbi:DMT family transporter [Halomonas aquatica]|uniref:DMT family transporter n=1 Tax=Halomonas aquatica TaxID=3151123 RepID=A0ABV1NEW7_9GAMM
MLSHTLRITRSHWHGAGAAGLAVLLWALVPLLVSAAGELPPLRLSALALLAGALGTLPMASRRHRHESAGDRGHGGGVPGPVLKGIEVKDQAVKNMAVHAGGALLVAGAVGACFVAFDRVPTAEAALITYTWPVLFLLANRWLVLRRLPLATLGGTLLAFSGAALLVVPQALSGGLSGAWGGYLLAFVAALCWAIFSLASQVPGYRLGERMPHLLLIASVMTGVASLAMEGVIEPPSPQALLATAALGLGPYGIAMLAWDRALGDPQAHRLGNLAHAVPVLATLFLVIAGVTTPDWRLPMAAVLVLAGSMTAAR